MTDSDAESGRNFETLDAHETQIALAEELGAEADEQDAVREEENEAEKVVALAPVEAGEETELSDPAMEAVAEAIADAVDEALAVDAAEESSSLQAEAEAEAEAEAVLGDGDDEAEGSDAEADSPEEAVAEEVGEEVVGEDDGEPVAAKPAPIEWSEEDLAEHRRMAEALLFAAAEPLDQKTIAERLPVGADIPTIIAQLTEDYATRGVHLQQVGKKWRFATAADVAHVLEKEKVAPRKLTRAALETLAIIAYHQPCTRADIEDVRGVQVAKGSLDQLLEIGWVKMRGKRKDAPGRPTLYGTTDAFLEQFTLTGIHDLPGLADLKAAGLLDARLPPGFSVPTPADAEDEDVEDGSEAAEAEFVQDFHDEADEINADSGDEIEALEG